MPGPRASTRSLRILYYGGGWPTNIGNAFIDLGALALLRAAVPEALIVQASEMPRWFFAHAPLAVPRSLWPKRRRPRPPVSNALDVAAITDCDVAVFAGMAMCAEFVEINGPTMLALARQGTRVLLLGTGGASYDAAEKELFGAFLRQLRPLAFISRDAVSFEMFRGDVPEAHRGIDCGFFLADAFQPFPVRLPPYVLAAFDGGPEPELALKGRRVIRAHHACWGALEPGYLETRDTLISDLPQDYLTLCANADEVHSDRVHACVAALAYGRPARLYSSTPRGHLFEAAGVAMVTRKLCQLDRELLAEKKAAQVRLVRSLLFGLGQPGSRSA